MKKNTNNKGTKQPLKKKLPKIILAIFAIAVVLFYTFQQTNNSNNNAGYTNYANITNTTERVSNSPLTETEDTSASTIDTYTSPSIFYEDTIDQDGVPYQQDALEESTGNVILNNSNNSQRKIAKSASINLRTKDFDLSSQKITEITEQVEGYFAYASSANQPYDNAPRYADYTIMVPSQNYQSFIDLLADVGSITSQSETSDDLTASYIDVVARITALKTQETRLLELMAQASDIDTILTIQAQLTEIQYQIESYASTQRFYDNITTYSTISLSISDYSASPNAHTFKDQVNDALSNTLKNTAHFLGQLLIGFIYAIPVLILIFICVVLFLLIKKAVNKKIAKTKFNQSLKSTPLETIESLDSPSKETDSDEKENNNKK